jgi:hypothetical protein
MILQSYAAQFCTLGVWHRRCDRTGRSLLLLISYAGDSARRCTRLCSQQVFDEHRAYPLSSPIAEDPDLLPSWPH